MKVCSGRFFLEKRGTAGGVGGYAVLALAQILLLLALLMGASVLIARGWVQQGRGAVTAQICVFLAAAAGSCRAAQRCRPRLLALIPSMGALLLFSIVDAMITGTEQIRWGGLVITLLAASAGGAVGSVLAKKRVGRKRRRKR